VRYNGHVARDEKRGKGDRRRGWARKGEEYRQASKHVRINTYTIYVLQEGDAARNRNKDRIGEKRKGSLMARPIVFFVPDLPEESRQPNNPIF
jgi:hypothetical protein